METFQVELGQRSYQVLIAAGLLREVGKQLIKIVPGKRLYLVTNTTIGALYGRAVRESLAEAGFQLLYQEVDDGEEFKSLESAETLYTAAITGGIERSSVLVALGGGVVGDLAGFVAATYMRGIPLIQLPTTLLAQVDSSIGGKVAVNHSLGKNMIGSFYQPRLVCADLDALTTLPVRELRSGLAEVIKYGVIWDEDFFEYLEEHLDQIMALDHQVLTEVIGRSCAIKAEVVTSDETEQGLRAILNFGHTIGHALETLTDYQLYRHGEAIAVGMVVATTIAVEMGICSQETRKRLVELLRRAGLLFTFPFTPEQVIPLLARDKKSCGGKPSFVLPLSLGKVVISLQIDNGQIAAALRHCQEKGGICL